jgi:WD40 repeat protein
VPASTQTSTPTPTPHPLALSPANVGQIEELAQLTKGTAYDVAWSPDGTLLAVATYKGVDLYDGQSFQFVRQLPAYVHRLAFNPASGELVIVASEGVSWIDLVTGQALHQAHLQMNHVDDVQFSPNGTYLALVGIEIRAHDDVVSALQVLNATSGESIFFRTDPDTNPGITFSPDGHTLAFGSSYGAYLLDVATGAVLIDLVFATTSPVYTADGLLIVSPPRGARGLRLVDPATGQVARRLATPPADGYLLGPDGQTLVLLQSIISSDTYQLFLEFWDVAADRSLGVVEEDYADPAQFAFSPSGDQLAMISRWQEVRILRLADASPVATIEYDKDVVGLQFLPDFRSPPQPPVLLSVHRDGHIRLRNALSLDELLLDRQVKLNLEQIALSPDGSLLAVSDWAGLIEIQDTISGNTATQIPCLIDDYRLDTLAFSRDGRYFASGCGGLLVFDTASWTEVRRGPRVLRLLPLDDGRLLSVVQAGDHVQLSDALSGDVLLTLMLPESAQALTPLNFADWVTSHDHSQIALGTTHGDIIVWRLGQPEPVRVLRLPNATADEEPQYSVTALAFNPASPLLAVSTDDRALRFWDASTGALLLTIADLPNQPSYLAFSPDGRYLAGSTGGTIRVWGLPAP